MRSRLRALVALLILAVPLYGAAASPAIEAARRAASACRAGDRTAAIAALQELVAAADADFGPSSTASELARINLKHLGESLPAAPASKGRARKQPAELDRELAGLRPCAELGAPTAPPSLGATPGGVGGFDETLAAARQHYDDGRYADGAVSAEAALRAGRGPEQIMRSNEVLANLRRELGDRDGALRAAQDAEAAARFSGDVTVRIVIARLVAQTGDLERAQAALAGLEKAAGSGAPRAEWLEAQGELTLLLGSPTRAVAELEKAVDQHVKEYGAEHPSTAAAWKLLGDAHRQSGDFPRASRAYLRALEIRRKALGESRRETADTWNALGVLRADLGDWAAADDAFASASSVLERALGPTHPETLSVRLNRARVAWGRTPSEANAKSYRTVVEDLGRALGQDHPRVAIALRNLAKVEVVRGRLDPAEALLDRALAAQTRRLGADHPDTATTRLERGRLLARRGEFAAAAQEIAKAVDSLVASLGPEHPAVAGARAAAARVAVSRGDPATALRESLEAARVADLHQKRSLGAMSDRQRALLATQSEEVVGALLSVPGAPARQIYTALLPHRDSVVRSSAASQAFARERGRETRALLDGLIAKRERYVAMVLGDAAGNAARAADLGREIEALEARAVGVGARVVEPPAAQVLSEACRRLPADAAVIELVAFDRSVPGSPKAPTAAYMAIVTRAPACDVTAHDLGDAAAIEAAAQRFDAAMREQQPDEERALEELGRRLLEPLAKRLAGANRWLVIPDGRLWGIPLGALPDPGDRSRYLIDRVTVGYLTSIYELADADPTDTTAAIPRPLLFGAPDFGASTGRGPVIVTASGPCELAAFEPLPGTKLEIDEIASLLETPRVVTGAAATKRRLHEELALRPGALHLATHGYFAGHLGCGSNGSPDGSGPIQPDPLLLSGVVLAGANASTDVGAEGSGFLTAYEISGLDLRTTRLVVLSACDTGAGSRQRGQEVQGLRFAFRAAGADSLVTSTWTSNDAATRALMHAFYQALGATDVPRDVFRGAEALRRAQRERIADDRRLNVRRPLLWANFVFSGVL